MAPQRADVLVIGGGPGGERAAIQAARAGKSVVLVERFSQVGGNRINWGTLPSKTLRESALFVHGLTRNRLHGFRFELADEITVADFTYRQRLVVKREVALVTGAYEKYDVEVVHGQARFEGPHTAAVKLPSGETRTFEGEVVVIAVGSRPNRPTDVPFDGEAVFDSETILELPRIPKSMIVLGAGVIGIEYASIFAALGLTVSLVDTRDRLLPYVDREIVAVLGKELSKLGVTVTHEDRYEEIRHEPGQPVRCRTRKGQELTADVLLYCVGRDGNTTGLGLETLGIVPNSYGLLTVNENFQTSVPHVYAVGDVVGYPALASTSMEQGRRAIRHALGLPGPRGKTDAFPFAIYSIPELSVIGESEEQLVARGADYVVGTSQYEMNPRGQIQGDTGGLLKLLFDAKTGTLLGAHHVGQGASELIHIAQSLMQGGVTAQEVGESIYNYPTLADLYRHAALMAHVAMLRRREG